MRNSRPITDGGGEHVARLLGERGQPAADHLADALRQLGRPRRAVAVARPAGPEVADHLLDEERVALGLLQQRAVDVLGQRVGAELADQLGRVGLVEPAQLDRLEVLLAAELDEDVRERVGPLGVAEAGDDEHRLVLGRADELAHHQQRRLVGPVQVVEHEHDRLRAGDVGQHLRGGVEQPVALGRLDRRRRRAVADELGDDAPELGAPRREPVGLGARGVAAQRLHERLVGDERLGVAAAVQRDRALGLARRHELQRRGGSCRCPARPRAARAGGGPRRCARSSSVSALELAAAAHERRAAAGGEELGAVLGRRPGGARG